MLYNIHFINFNNCCADASGASSHELLYKLYAYVCYPLLIYQVAVESAQVAAELSGRQHTVFIFFYALEVNTVSSNDRVIESKIEQGWLFDAWNLMTTAHLVTV